MEILGPALAVGAFVLVIGLVAFVIGRARRGRKRDAYLEYLSALRPDMAPEFLMASRVSKSAKSDIALAIDQQHRDIIVMTSAGGEITHEVYPFSTLEGVEIESQIISRGIKTQRTYSYERTMRVLFSGGHRYQFVLENISDKHGRKGTDVVKAAFEPWERSLTAIAEGATSVG